MCERNSLGNNRHTLSLVNLKTISKWFSLMICGSYVAFSSSYRKATTTRNLQAVKSKSITREGTKVISVSVMRTD